MKRSASPQRWDRTRRRYWKQYRFCETPECVGASTHAEVIQYADGGEQYQIISTTSSPDRRGVSVHVRPAATAAAASDSRQPPPKTEYTFFLTISEDGRQIVKVDMAVHSEH